MKNVLDVGQCSLDHAAIRRLVEGHFDARVSQAHDAAQALAKLRGEAYDLVLVNRRLDGDGSDGLEIIRALQADPRLAAVSVMLVTNYPQFQEQAVAAGAEPGFGKADLDEPQTLERLGKVLG